MMRFLRRLRRSAGEYFFSGGSSEYTEAPVSGCEGDAFSSAMFYCPGKYRFTPGSPAPRARMSEIFAKLYLYKLEMYCSCALATASCDWTTSTESVTPALNRSRDCVKVWSAKSTLLLATFVC